MTNQTAVFGGGCFWCTEAAFQVIRGVSRVAPGYAGGPVGKPAPSYEQVCTGRSGHAEVVQVTYDPDAVSYKDLLTVFFATHDPTTLNRQGNDIGSQYRSAIFYADEAQKTEAEAFVSEHAGEFGRPIVTEIAPLTEFFEAEEYHHDYFKRNPFSGYCMAVIPPKLSKLRAKYAELVSSD
jgi:peptide-methionine (S)-S-oxide reductase